MPLPRRADVVGIFPSEASIVRLIGAVLLEANDEWQLQHRYLGVEALAELLNPDLSNETLQLPHPRPPEPWAASATPQNSTTLTDVTEQDGSWDLGGADSYVATPARAPAGIPSPD